MNPSVSSDTRESAKYPTVTFPALSSLLGQAPNVQPFPARLQTRTEQLSEPGGQETRKEVLASGNLGRNPFHEAEHRILGKAEDSREVCVWHPEPG